MRVEHGEIADLEEETTVTDCLARVQRLFPDTRICKFNAFGRIAHIPGSSEALRALLSRMAPPRNVNTTFELQWAVESLPLRRQKRMLDSLFQVRFSHGASYVKHDVKSITEPEVLRELFERVVLSCSPRTCIAHQVGIAGSLAPIAALVERDIPVGPDTLACLLALLGPNDPVYTRAYIRLFSGADGSNGTYDTVYSTRACIANDPTKCACRSYTFVAPARLTALTTHKDVHPAVFALDVEATCAGIRACSDAYGARLTEARASLWNTNEDSTVPGSAGSGAEEACWRMLVTASWLGKISSVLAPIE